MKNIQRVPFRNYTFNHDKLHISRHASSGEVCTISSRSSFFNSCSGLFPTSRKRRQLAQSLFPKSFAQPYCGSGRILSKSTAQVANFTFKPIHAMIRTIHTYLNAYSSIGNYANNPNEMIPTKQNKWRKVSIRFNTISPGGERLSVNQYAELYRRFTVEDIFTFGNLVGDLNPIHVKSRKEKIPKEEDKYNQNDSRDIRIEIKDVPIVHGQLVSSLASSIFGTLIPGSIYRSQHLVYRKPVYANELLKCRLVITKLRKMKIGTLVVCDMTVFNYGDVEGYGPEQEEEKEEVLHQNQICVDGEVKIWIPK